MNKNKIISFVKGHKILTSVFGLLLLIVALLAWFVLVVIVEFGGGSYGYDGYAVEEYDRAYPQVESTVVSKSADFAGVSSYMPSVPSYDSDGAYDEGVERKLIKKSNLSVVVEDVESSQNKILKITKKYKGFISNSDFNTNDYVGRGGREYSRTSGYMNIKIPSESFELAFDDFKSVALLIQRENIYIDDVTEEYSDLETRIKNKKAEEVQYREILKTAKKVEDVLKVTQYINSARAEVERLEGRMNYLSNQIKLSEIRIDIVSEDDISAFGVTWSPIYEIKKAFTNMIGDFKDFANGLIGFLFKLPILIIWVGIVYVGVRLVLKKVRKVRGKRK